mgnify:CR=1 FL=1
MPVPGPGEALVRVTAHQKSAVGITTYANSITLTPGTVAMEVTEHDILVHGLTRTSLAALADGEMDRRVSELRRR